MSHEIFHPLWLAVGFHQFFQLQSILSLLVVWLYFLHIIGFCKTDLNTYIKCEAQLNEWGGNHGMWKIAKPQLQVTFTTMV
jgi:hypothetical protein